MRPDLARFVRCWVWLLALGAPSLSIAQDVWVTPVAWLEPDDPPDQLPTRKRPFRPVFPDELKKTRDLGWGMLEVWLDEDGKVVRLVTYGTQPAYARALAESYDAKIRFKPGQREGRPVHTRVRVTAVFHPATAAEKSPEATPRLLDAQVIVDPRQKPEYRQGTYANHTVWAKVKVTRTGEAALVEDAPTEVGTLIQRALTRWRFAPARRAGEAIDAEVLVPFVVVPPDVTPTSQQTPPKVLKTVPPHYPWGLRESGLRGEVVLEFVVDYEGRVRNPAVVRTLNPAFNAAAIAAIRQWRFAPGQIEGRSVNTLMQQAIRFELTGEPDGGADGFEVRQRADLSKLPPELRYDTPPKIETMVLPKYPYALLRERKRGSAQVKLLVGVDGRVLAARVVKASQPEFGYALQAAAELFAFRPAVKDGQPTVALYGFEHEFTPSDRSLVSASDEAALQLEQKHPERLLAANKLDHALKPGTTKSPQFPSGVPTEVHEGQALVELLIDEEGRVCVPRVTSASRPEFGYAAVQAVAEWRFPPPTSGGKPGAVRVSVPFAFSRPPVVAPTPEP